MSFFDEFLLPVFATAAVVATGGTAAPAVGAAGTGTAAAGANAATNAFLAKAGTKTAADVAVGNIAAGTGLTATPGLTAGLTPGLTTGLTATPGLTAGVGTGVGAGSGIMQAAPGITSAVPEVAATTQAAAAPELATQAVVPEAAGNISQGINQIGPTNMSQVNPINPANYGNAVPGMPENAPFGSVYQTPAVTNAGFPDILGNSVGNFSVTPPVPSALERGFDKALAFAEKNPIAAYGAASTFVNGILGPQQPDMPKKRTSSGPRYTLSPNFQGTTDDPNPYKVRYAEGGITSLAQGGMGDNQGYPQGRLDTTQYATPSQMPTSAQVVNADYEVPTDPYTGSPLKMAEGGIAGYALGGMPNSGSQVYYDPQKGQYYTQSSFPAANMMSSAMGGNGGRQYINADGSLVSGGMGGKGKGGANSGSSEFNSPTIVPNVYESGYDDADEPAAPPVSNIPMLQAIQNSQQQINSGYDLLAQTAPNIAMMSGAPPSAFENAAANMATSAAAPAATTAAQGGIMGYRGGGIPAPDIDVGIVTEDDPDFAFTSPYQTAAGRLEKLYKKTHINRKPPPAAPKLGTIDLTPANMKKAAGGGIMGAAYNLGGYAAGGNPRLLKGPGDGMSDNIPAVIGNRQPARLADGEFVIPADVVSHLGNGSTDAGAKHLHKMMDTVRKARTGRKAQGKQINAAKFIPK
jgi:hypothetical protein